MRYFRSTFLNRKILNSQAHNNFYLLGFPRSKPAFLSTFSSPSSTLHQTPNPGIPVSQSWRHTTFACESSSPEQPPPPPPPKLAPTERISGIVDEVSGLTLMETMDLFELVRQKMGMGTDVIPTMFVMMPGMGFGGKSAGKSAGGGAAAEEKKAEKTAFDLKLEGFDAASKIKIIKEVRTFTDLGLKEAKDLVEKAPTLLKKGVLKEEAEKIIQKMKDLGAKVVME